MHKTLYPIIFQKIKNTSNKINLIFIKDIYINKLRLVISFDNFVI